MATIEITKLQRGDGDKFPFKVFLDDKITPDDLANFTNILVYVNFIEDGTLIEKYAMNTKTGYNDEDFHITDGPAGEFYFVLQPSKLLTGKLGEYQVTIKTQRIDTDFEDNLWPVSYEEKLCKLVENKNAE